MTERATRLDTHGVNIQIYPDALTDDEDPVPPMVVITCDPGMAILVNGKKVAGPPEWLSQDVEPESPSVG